MNEITAKIQAGTSAKRQEEKRAWKDKNRIVRIDRVSRKLADRFERQRHIVTGDEKIDRRNFKRPMVRLNRVKNPRVFNLVAYDFETTSIKKGTPRPLYITAFGANMCVSSSIKSLDNLRDILERDFLTVENNKTRFVAWNGNKFDAYFIALALLTAPGYILKPYLTKGKALRGIKVISETRANLSWEFLDGITMTGMTGTPLDTFLKTFAPDYQKLDAPDWENEEFNSKNRKHVEYAERDSEGLYYALIAAQKIMLDCFSVPLQPTIGKAGIRIFQQYIPMDVAVYDIPYSAGEIVRNQVMRGGYCFCVEKYDGPIWKYDINQAYAAAMREAKLPEGRCFYVAEESRYAQCAIYRVKAINENNIVPFYVSDLDGQKIFATTHFESWITSLELKQLRAEGWTLQVIEGYCWESSFKMTEYVNTLEDLRINNPEGPKGAQGTIIKAIGNNSYGKTVERLEGLELAFSLNRPEGFSEYLPADSEIQNIWFKIGKPMVKSYHQPQIGAFITAHVRMVLRRAILLKPSEWLYADTDCVIFKSKPDGLDIDSKRYGAFKVECEGELFRIIDKKVYANHGATEKHSKGMNVKRLTDDDFKKWYDGEAPTQKQTQKQNFVKTLTGQDMFIERTRRGSDKNSLKNTSKACVTDTALL